MLNIRSVELTEINLPLVHFFETSFGRTYERRIILVRVEDTDGAEGWGEITCGESPGYSDEWTDSAWVTAEKILAPMVVGKRFESAADVWDLMKWARGHRMAKAGIETACWDLEAKKLGVPLWRHLGGVNQTIECGVSIGIQDSIEQLLEKIRVEVEAGYKRIKIKISPTWDYDVIKAVRAEFGDILLMGDANSAYTLADIDKLKSLDEFDLMMLEQPLPHDDIIDHAKLQARDQNTDLPRRTDQITRRRPQGDRTRLRQDHQPKKRPRRRPLAVKTDRKDLPRSRNARLVRRHARIRHRPRPQHRHLDPRRLHHARRRLRLKTLLARRHHRTGGRGFSGRNDHRTGRAGNWV